MFDCPARIKTRMGLGAASVRRVGRVKSSIPIKRMSDFNGDSFTSRVRSSGVYFEPKPGASLGVSQPFWGTGWPGRRQAQSRGTPGSEPTKNFAPGDGGQGETEVLTEDGIAAPVEDDGDSSGIGGIGDLTAGGDAATPVDVGLEDVGDMVRGGPEEGTWVYQCSPVARVCQGRRWRRARWPSMSSGMRHSSIHLRR